MARPVVLASLEWLRPRDPRTGLGVASIASALAASGVSVQLVTDAVNRPGFAVDDWIQRVVGALDQAGPSALLGISAFVWNEPEVLALLRAVSVNARATIVVGGPQVSYVGAGGLEALYPQAHAFVRGHGEAAMVALATGSDLLGLGLHLAGSPDLGQRADLDLTALPSPHLDGTLLPTSYVRWETQRGCPFRCSFCQHREAGARLRHQALGDDRVICEARAFAARGVRRLSVLDPIFHADRARAVALLHVFREEGLRAELSLQCRFELVNDDFLDALDGLDVCLEFGLQTVHTAEGRAVGRPNKLRKASDVIACLHERGVRFEVSLIYGLPLQTLDSFRASVDWCLDHRVPIVRAWPLMLLRGTPLQAERDRWGFVESVGERIPIVVASDTFTRADHAAMARIADGLMGVER